MALTLYYHPLSSFCWKALIALYECKAEFTPRLVNLGDPEDAAAFKAIWPVRKFPVLQNGDQVTPESTIIIEYLAQHYPAAKLIPSDPERAREVRLWDRVIDMHVHLPMQKFTIDALRPQGAKDPMGVESARETLRTAYALLDKQVSTWVVGDEFTMADCAAFPALYYANIAEPIGAEHASLLAYLERLRIRPSIARVFKEAEPYFHMLPLKPKSGGQ
ncbi:MAG TPA: glutathione S-transferase family protein [Caulobacterales bacterium]|nr:glutathione S-transferase family protein [Caulobacterales bacterium]